MPRNVGNVARGASKDVYKIAADDEYWIYEYEPETKQQSTVWLFEPEPNLTNTNVVSETSKN